MMPHTRHRPRRRTLLRAAALPLLIVAAAAALALLVRPAATVVPLDPHIPHEQALLDAGFAGVPRPDQPDAPVAVDRVLVDGAATYVQYHMAVPVGTPLYPMPALPILADGRGVPVPVSGGDRFSTGDVSPAAGWTLPVALPAWLPWHPTTVRRFYAALPPLPARAVALRFCLNVGQRGCSPVETILVPLDPRAAALRRRAHPGTTTHAAGVTLALRDLGVTHLTYTYIYAPPGGTPYLALPRIALPTPGRDVFTPLPDALRDAAGRPVPAVARPTVCATRPRLLRCAVTLVFPPQPPGARLTLTIRAVQLDPLGLRGARLGSPKVQLGPPTAPRPTRGPWLLPVVIP